VEAWWLRRVITQANSRFNAGPGAALHLSGQAEISWTGEAIPGDDGGTGRRVHFTPRRLMACFASVHSEDVEAYRDNPSITTPEA
jgi:hypothetical protein